MKMNLIKRLGAASVLALGIASCDMSAKWTGNTKEKMPSSFTGVTLFVDENDEFYIKSIYEAGRVIKDGKNFGGKETLIYYLKCNGNIEKNPYMIQIVESNRRLEEVLYSNRLEEVYSDRDRDGFVDSPGMVAREMSPETTPRKNLPKCR